MAFIVMAYITQGRLLRRAFQRLARPTPSRRALPRIIAIIATTIGTSSATSIATAISPDTAMATAMVTAISTGTAMTVTTSFSRGLRRWATAADMATGDGWQRHLRTRI